MMQMFFSVSPGAHLIGATHNKGAKIVHNSEFPVELSVIIPLYNEAACLIPNVESTISHLAGMNVSYEIVLVDDGSRDGTLDLCHVLAERFPEVRVHGHKPNRGKGYAVKSGMLAGRGEYLLFMDADLAVPLDYLNPCLEKLRQGSPVVIASRHARGAAICKRESPLREILGKVFRKMALLGLGLPVSDVTCGLKAFSSEARLAVFNPARIERWTYDAEILLLASRLGYSISEVPITWFHNDDSAVRVLKDAVQSMMDLIRIKYWAISGAYEKTGKP